MKLWTASIVLHLRNVKSYYALALGPLFAITSARPTVCWISINKDVFYEFHQLFKLQSRNSLKCGSDRNESLLEGKRIERRLEKTHAVHAWFCGTSCKGTLTGGLNNRVVFRILAWSPLQLGLLCCRDVVEMRRRAGTSSFFKVFVNLLLQSTNPTPASGLESQLIRSFWSSCRVFVTLIFKFRLHLSHVTIDPTHT